MNNPCSKRWAAVMFLSLFYFTFFGGVTFAMTATPQTTESIFENICAVVLNEIPTADNGMVIWYLGQNQIFYRNPVETSSISLLEIYDGELENCTGTLQEYTETYGDKGADPTGTWTVVKTSSNDNVCYANTLANCLTSGIYLDYISLSLEKRITIIGDNNIADISGSKGTDVITVGNNNSGEIEDKKGVNSITVGNGNNGKIVGGKDVDVIIVGDNNNEEIKGNGGDDSINVGAGNNGKIMGGNGSDTIIIGENNTGDIFGGNGNDTIIVGYGNTGNIDDDDDVIINVPPAPSVNLLPGTYTSFQEVELFSEETGSIFYTIDGTIPDCLLETGTFYESPISIFSTKTITVVACEEKYASPVASFVYTIIDTVAPTVVKLGDNSTDVVLSVGDINLIFSEVLSDSSKASVEHTLAAGSDEVLTYAWEDNYLRITTTKETTFVNDVVVNVSDAASNSVDLLLIDSALMFTQKVPDSNGSATVDSLTPQIVIFNPTQAVDIIVSNGTINPTIDVSSFILDGTGILPAITITSANANNANVAIPASTSITSADIAWDGIIAAPTVTTITLPVTEGETKTLSSAIEIGFLGAKLSFDKAVRILLSDQAGKRAGYVRTGTVFTEITNICIADNQATGNALAIDGDCKIDVGKDLVIWTKHFTTFATYTQQATIPTPSNSGGGGSMGEFLNGPLVNQTSQPNPLILITPISIPIITPNATHTSKPGEPLKIAEAKTLQTITSVPIDIAQNQSIELASQQSLQRATILGTIGQVITFGPRKILDFVSWILKI